MPLPNWLFGQRYRASSPPIVKRVFFYFGRVFELDSFFVPQQMALADVVCLPLPSQSMTTNTEQINSSDHRHCVESARIFIYSFRFVALPFGFHGQIKIIIIKKATKEQEKKIHKCCVRCFLKLG